LLKGGALFSCPEYGIKLFALGGAINAKKISRRPRNKQRTAQAAETAVWR